MAPVTTTTALKLLPELWSPGLLKEAYEAMIIVKDFAKAPGATKIGQKLHIPKMLAIAATTPGSPSGTGLTYTANTEQEVTVDPLETYAAVEIQRAVRRRMNINPDSPYRDMIKRGVAQAIDIKGGTLASGLTTNVKGSALASMDLGLMLDVQQALVVSCGENFRPGRSPWFIKMHSTQVKNTMGIFNLTADYARGDSVKPFVSGWLSPVLNANIDVSGNIYTSGGIAHHLAFIPEAFVIGFNEEPTVLEPQDVELVTRIIAVSEFGVSEAWDEYACDVQTAA